MRRIEHRLDAPAAAAAASLSLPTLLLDYGTRSKSRFKAMLSNGDDVGVFMPRGSVLRGGDVLACDDAQLVKVVAAEEDVMVITAASFHALLRASYHLGNRHTQMEIGADYLKLAYDSVLADMARRLGLSVKRKNAPFEPEGGAYSFGGHSHAVADTLS
jgi:urease accessory protein